MLELTWPGKAEAAHRAFTVEKRVQPAPWALSFCDSPENTQKDDASAHRLLAGDNLDVMHWLHRTDEKYDVIYIDPPYNTGSSLTYNDKKSGRVADQGGGSVPWLNEIYPRLLLARELLRDNGVFFVSIDDNEVCHLMTLLREIFGHRNHLGTIKWRRKRKPSFLDRHMSSLFEYVLVFARDAESCPRLLGEETEELTRPVLNATNKSVERIIPEGFSAHCPDGHYPAGVHTNRSLSFELLDPVDVTAGRVVCPARVRGPFRIQQELWQQTGFITKNFGLRRHVLSHEKKRRHAEDDGTQWPTNEDAQDELKAVFGERVFDFPKPVGLLTRLLAMVEPAKDRTVQRCLDFYAGSGSFLIAALEQSRCDGFTRQVDLVQSCEKVRNDSKGRFSDIAEICAHRVWVDSRLRGFTPPLRFLKFEQQE